MGNTSNVSIQTETIDGKERIWFPAVEYRNKKTGELTKYPPVYTYPKDTSYHIVVHDVDQYFHLCRLGLLFDPRHTGRPNTPLIDNRNVTM